MTGLTRTGRNASSSYLNCRLRDGAAVPPLELIILVAPASSAANDATKQMIICRHTQVTNFPLQMLGASRLRPPMPETVPLEIIALARRVGVAHGIEPQLVCAVIEQESAWNPWAVRYEPGFLSRYVAPLYTAGKVSATEAYTRSMSWGLMQVMGQVAREFGFSDPSLAELCDPATGVEFGCRILAVRLLKSKDDVPAALQAWNGGADANYAAEVMARKRNYSAKPT